MGNNFKYISVYLPLLLICIFISCSIQAQDAGLRIENSSGAVYLNIGSNAKLNISSPGNTGGIRLENGGSIDNSGSIQLAAGAWINNGNGLVNGSAGAVQLDNSVTQPVQGSSVSVFYDLVINNAAGVSLNKDVVVNHALILTSGTLAIGNHTLTINGAVSGSGTLAGSSVSNLVIGAAAGTLNFDQASASTRSLKNITFNSGGSATLGTVLDVYGDIEFTPSTGNSFNVNGKHLTLKSGPAYTARIGDLTGSTLSGATNVTVERFINLRTPGSGYGTGNYGRAYRLIAPTVSSAGSIKANWMEGVNTIGIGAINDPNPGYGVQITGPGGAASGFDVTQTNASSLYYASNAATPIYTAVPNSGTALNPYTGYFLYVRGDRSMDITIPLSPGTMPTSSTTMRATGTIETGNKSSFTNAFTGGTGMLNLVTNPYPSPIYWPSVFADGSNITNAYTYWDPNVGNRGGFVTVNTAGAVNTPESGTPGGNRYIQSGQAFFIQASGAATPALTLKETHKAAADNSTVFLAPPPPLESFRTSLYYTEANNYRQVADGAIAVYGDYNAAIDANDAFEINNWDENIAIAREGKHLAIESRPVILTKDTIPLFMNNMKERAYEFQFEPAVFTNIGLKAELVDNFLHKRSLLSVVNSTVVPFTVTADPASKAANRFMIVFGPQRALAIDVLTIEANAKNDGVQVNWSAKTEQDMDHYELERSFTGTIFARINTTAALGNSAAPVNYTWFDAAPQNGLNYYRIKAVDKSGAVKYTNMVKVDIGKTNPVFTIYPNPVTNNTIGLRLSNAIKGNYRLQLYTATGQTLHTQQNLFSGGTAVITIEPAGKLAAGIYYLESVGPDGAKLLHVVRVE